MNQHVNFQQEVIERSQEIPVVVDFWAEWCGPCRVLGPIIEGMAEQAGGKWALVKLNTEIQPDVSNQFQIRGIPAVKMFWKGEVIAEFTGALPQSHIQKWLDEFLPDDNKSLLADIKTKLEAGETEGVIHALENLVSRAPDLVEARALLALQKVTTQPATALDLVEDLRAGSPYFDQAEDVRTLGRLLAFEESEPEALTLKLKGAAEALRAGDEEAAISRIIEAVMMNKSFADDLPRKAAIALFHRWGWNHPFTRKYRRRFDMALY